jgi:hypothetical protein
MTDVTGEDGSNRTRKTARIHRCIKHNIVASGQVSHGRGRSGLAH